MLRPAHPAIDGQFCRGCEPHGPLMRVHGSADPHDTDFAAMTRLTDMCTSRDRLAVRAVQEMIEWMASRGIKMRGVLPGGKATA